MTLVISYCCYKRPHLKPERVGEEGNKWDDRGGRGERRGSGKEGKMGVNDGGRTQEKLSLSVKHLTLDAWL